MVVNILIDQNVELGEHMEMLFIYSTFLLFKLIMNSIWIVKDAKGLKHMGIT